MSTSANILFINIDIKTLDPESINLNAFEGEPVIYIHSDGFPQGLLKWLCPFLSTKGAKARQYDKQYLISWCLTYHNINRMARYLINYNCDDWKQESELIDKYIFSPDDFKKFNDFRGSGVYKYDSIYYDFLYIVSPDYSREGNTFNIYVYDSQGNFKGVYDV